MSSWSPTKYTTRNWRSYNTALKQRGSLSIWFDPEMPWHARPTGRRGRQPEFSDAAIRVCLTMKLLFDMPLRQTTGFVESAFGACRKIRSDIGPLSADADSVSLSEPGET